MLRNRCILILFIVLPLLSSCIEQFNTKYVQLYCLRDSELDPIRFKDALRNLAVSRSLKLIDQTVQVAKDIEASGKMPKEDLMHGELIDSKRNLIVTFTNADTKHRAVAVFYHGYSDAKLPSTMEIYVQKSLNLKPVVSKPGSGMDMGKCEPNEYFERRS